MQAIIQSEYGSADVLRLAEVEKLVIASNEVLVNVRGTSVHAGNWHLMRGDLFLIRLIFGGVSKSKLKKFVDKAYELAEVPDAMRLLEERQVKGKVAISV